MLNDQYLWDNLLHYYYLNIIRRSSDYHGFGEWQPIMEALQQHLQYFGIENKKMGAVHRNPDKVRELCITAQEKGLA
ncbi:hypothetical protein [Chitinophaga sp.]|uniref:hypothetical protein n=1 Tax=Chitinophaga sp. TaxID=1869181 RepID=UPI002F91C215